MKLIILAYFMCKETKLNKSLVKYKIDLGFKIRLYDTWVLEINSSVKIPPSISGRMKPSILVDQISIFKKDQKRYNMTWFILSTSKIQIPQMVEECIHLLFLDSRYQAIQSSYFLIYAFESISCNIKFNLNLSTQLFMFCF